MKKHFAMIIATTLLSACNHSTKPDKAKDDTVTIADSAAAATKEKADNKTRPLTVTVKNVSGNTPVVIRVYTQQNFLDKQGDKNKYSVKPDGGTATRQVDGLPYGKIAVVSISMKTATAI